MLKKRLFSHFLSHNRIEWEKTADKMDYGLQKRCMLIFAKNNPVVETLRATSLQEMVISFFGGIFWAVPNRTVGCGNKKNTELHPANGNSRAPDR